ncbi:MAG: TRC40/GET3/ArsA family transport-energizing ATPase [Acidobacteriota bacterium]
MRIFFSGKGGVGKTTMACATALHHARQGMKTLLVSTDPASNIADVLEQPIGYGVVPVEGAPNLWATEIDPDEAVQEYKARVLDPYRAIMPEDILASLEEQLSGPCTVEIAAFERFIDFMDGGDYDVVVFDTAPTGHTLRLLALSVEWSKYIEAAAQGSGQTCLGPVQTIQGAKAKYDQATALLKDPSETQFVFVMRPQALSVYETLRAAKELRGQGIRPARLIANGILPPEAGDGPEVDRKRAEQAAQVAEAERGLGLTAVPIRLRPEEVKGIPALWAVAQELYDGTYPALFSTQERPAPEAAVPSPDLETLLRPSPGRTKAFFFTGKGGVGKTTVSCVTALHLAGLGHRTLLVTTDPAAHLGRVLDRPVGAEPSLVAPNLMAVHIDQVKAFEEYKARVLEEAAKTASEEMLKATAEELDSPCTEEMAAFDKFARYFEDESYDFIVLDTAPTGHTLRLLDLPFQYAEQTALAAAEAKGDGAVQRAADARFQKLIARLKDPSLTAFAFVFYPEATPILESHRACMDLKAAGIHAQFLVANMVLSQEQAKNPFLQRRRAMQQRYLEEAHRRFGLPVLTLPLMEKEPSGLAALTHLGKALLEKTMPPEQPKDLGKPAPLAGTSH